jgi:flagellar FliL protein
MATAAPDATPASDAPAPKGKKKLIIIIAAVLLLVLIGGGVTVFMLKKKAADAQAAEDGGEAAHGPAAQAKPDPSHPPVFLALDPFTINLADKETDRFAQIGVTLEVKDVVTSEQLKAFMPSIRNNVLMILAHKTSAELLTLEGKEKLAREILRAAVRPMGVELDPDPRDLPPDAPPPQKKKEKPPESPVSRVLFSNFIVQ